jgi:peptidoglycan/xylan/chitin deacetylase (PgdA/CDA1 family)
MRPVSVVRQAARRGLAAVLPRRLYLTRGPRWSDGVCLTFDDGPHPELTPRLLDLLAERGVTATFFLVGREAEKYPAAVRRMKADGHAVGNHSYSHPARQSVSARQAAADVARGAEVLAGILGAAPGLYRPPGGKLTAGDLWRFCRAGLTTVLWNLDPKDYNKPSADPIRDWFRGRTIVGGDLILLHDTHPHALAVLPEVIDAARGRGLRFTTVSEWTG